MAIQSGWSSASCEPGAARNGASQSPACRPRDVTLSATASSPDGNESSVRVQSPTAAWNPSSSWSTSIGHSEARATSDVNDRSETCSK